MVAFVLLLLPLLLLLVPVIFVVVVIGAWVLLGTAVALETMVDGAGVELKIMVGAFVPLVVCPWTTDTICDATTRVMKTTMFIVDDDKKGSCI